VVKLGWLLSKWARVHARVPQGTKSGPILFLVMVNHWKYVDDITIAEVFLHGSSSTMQHDRDDISKWAQENSMNLNPKKCKEMPISFLRIDPEVPLLVVNNPHLRK